MSRANVVSTLSARSQTVDPDDILVRDPNWRGPYGRLAPAKRALDLALLLPAVVTGLPLLVVAALLVTLVSPGNPFYVQHRIGRHGRRFRVLKLRTMRRDAEAVLARHLADDPRAREEWSTHFKLTEDRRVLPVIGTLLRRASIDEIPQLWNIARGQMSFVGPRPFPSYHLEAFDPDFQRLRAEAVPGLTGLWQVSERADGDLTVQERLDRAYIERWSLGLDLKLLLRTPIAVLRGRGAR